MRPHCGRTCANLAKGKDPANVNTPVPANPVNAANRFPATSPTQGTTPGDVADHLDITPSTSPRTGSRSENRRSSVPVPSDIFANIASLMDELSTARCASSSSRICQIPGCGAPAHVGPNGFASKYCSRSHKQCVSRPSAPIVRACAE